MSTSVWKRSPSAILVRSMAFAGQVPPTNEASRKILSKKSYCHDIVPQLQAREGECHLSHRLPQARAPHTQTDLCCPICLKMNFLEVNLLCEHYSKPKTS